MPEPSSTPAVLLADLGLSRMHLDIEPFGSVEVSRMALDGYHWAVSLHPHAGTTEIVLALEQAARRASARLGVDPTGRRSVYFDSLDDVMAALAVLSDLLKAETLRVEQERRDLSVRLYEALMLDPMTRAERAPESETILMNGLSR